MDAIQGEFMNPAPSVAVSAELSRKITNLSRPTMVPQLGSNHQMTSITLSRQSMHPNKALPVAHESTPSSSSGGHDLINILSQSKFGHIISSLPTRNDWKMMPLHQYQGFWYFTIYLEAVLTAQNTFQAHPSDIFLCTFAKTGTTWLKALAFTILTRTRFDLSSNSPLLTSTPHDCVPFLEIDACSKENNRHRETPLLSTHIPYTSLPTSITELGCKLIYICRDPKDVLVSMWHFLRGKLPEGMDKDAYVSMNDSFESFCQGAANGGPYWDHVLGYWNASAQHPDKVLFLSYEDLKKDTVSVVRKLAEFMGYPFTPEEESEGLVQQIVDFCSFENLSDLKPSKSGAYKQNSPYIIENKSFYRKGKSGDWRNHFTEEMGARLDQIVEEKLSGSGFSFLKFHSQD